MIQTLPGIAITYMGEELGMENVRISWNETVDPQACNGALEGYHERSRDPARTPFPWDNTKNAGFTSGDKTWLPVGTAYSTVNVRAQQEATNSHLKIFKSLTSRMLKYLSSLVQAQDLENLDRAFFLKIDASNIVF